MKETASLYARGSVFAPWGDTMAVTALARQPDVDSRRQRLLDIIRERSLLKDGDFKLASGERSSFFFDMKKTMLDPEGANLIADLILAEIGHERIDAIGGLVMGAVPIVAAVCAKSFYGRYKINGFFVRKEPKGHGTNQLIDGNIEPGMNVVIIDDVTTKGESVFNAVKAAQDYGCNVKRVITVVDRLAGAKERLARESISLSPLFVKDDFA